ncbi:MAG TPA: O-antigen ligase family protein [Solirubrobacterales bacterium]|nr:O-antigen ligase family protein [Solirubrobacterales bacterium]
MISPPALILGLLLSGGGFFLSERHVAGLAVWLLLVILLALGAAGRATLGHPFWWGTGLIGGLALFSAFSSLWSGSVELSVIEADRVLVYLGFFLAAFLIAQTDQRRQRFAEGIGIALIGGALLALASRLLPHVFELGAGPGSGARLGYPFGYWNANGLAFGIGVACCLWMSRRALRALRWVAAGAIPVLLLALYFTYSRGGLLGLLVACGCLIALSHDRLLMMITLAIGALGALPAVLQVQASRSLADNYPDHAMIDQGVTVLAILLGGIALSLALFALLRRLERRGGTFTGRALQLSRDRRILRGVAIAGAVVAIGAAIAVGGRAWDQFSKPDQQFPGNPAEHFSQINGANRHEFWRVAIDSFGEQPLLGHGAGTYQFSWDKLRHISVPVLDAHSLYLEAFSELGVIGGLLVLGLVGTLLWNGFAAWRAARGPRRELHAILFAACLTFAVGAAIDWFWEIAAAGAIFFLAAGALVAARCVQLAQARAQGNGSSLGERRRFGLTVAGLAVAWIVALALIGPLLVDSEIDSSNAAAADGNMPSAVDHADTARSIEPWAATPYVHLSLLAESQAEYDLAAERMGQAIDREDENWQLYYLRARMEHEGGDEAAARVDLEEARRLNPEEKCLEEGFEGCG